MIAALLACSPSQPGGDAGAMYRIQSTGDTASRTSIVIGCVGQSNMSGVVPKGSGFAHSLLGDQAGVHAWHNGVELAEWPTFVGPQPFVVDELLALGWPAEDIWIVTRATPGAALEVMRTSSVPALAADLAALDLELDGLIFWQGEADARGSTAAGYERKLNGSDGQPSLRGLQDELFGAYRWSVIELRVRDTGYASYAGQQLVRAAQHMAGAYANTCTIPSYDLPLLPGQNQPHVSLVGLEIGGRRALHGVLDTDTLGAPACP